MGVNIAQIIKLNLMFHRKKINLPEEKSRRLRQKQDG